MPHDTPLIATIVIGLCLAFFLGAIAQRIRVSPLVGYLLAGVALGPHTPGFVADQALASELAEIGVILLMFGVGLHFSLRDLWSVRAIAIPGAIAQIAVATGFGAWLGHMLGWSMGASVTFGLALSVASTVVLLRALQERRVISTERGRIAVGWLIVEDLVMVLTLVLLPALVPLLDGSLGSATPSVASEIFQTLALTVAKVAAFIAIMLIVGRRVIPWILHYVAHGGSRELFRLAVLSIALGCAYGAAQLFGVSFALGAFFAGMILSESTLSQQAASETLPLRDAFAVLFFISVGMLFDPMILVRDPLPVLATVGIIVVVKSLAALLIVLAFRYPLGTAVTIAVSLAQIGEFSFILAGLGVTLGLLPPLGRELILAGAIISILLNPLLFFALDGLKPWLEAREATPPASPPAQEPAGGDEIEATQQQGHTVIVGCGRIGFWLSEALARGGVPLFVIDEKDDVVAKLRARNIEAVAGSAPAALPAANLARANALFVAVPAAFEAGQIVAQARAANRDLFIVAHAHSDAEAAYLSNYGANAVVQGSREIADAMVARLSAAPTAMQTAQGS
ncbi:MAG: Kef family K(+) transporter [Hyphomicrobium sp.]|uniref:YbaL family putative K(+) efflux transporter n=1 Tax=Hyphomicrobium sp. TaxID=82 RepID=UPI0013294A1C|nr:YbaL family putative K(+) efflux transporter [Hyphomicrobium sp.]KAB2944036.1 MAG: Kef family K(+) transporter [Hyphomicrobium sp.]MBZ0209328.1 Kef family K(+) transporter [Hyphomicrobium sp.]